jgi:hypothetical protein
MKLKPCPFCGEQKEISTDKYQSGYWKTRCVMCRGGEALNEKLAIQEWNTRPIEDKLQAENSELLLADKRNTEICEKFEAELAELQARNDTLHEDYDAMVEVISDKDAEIVKLKNENTNLRLRRCISCEKLKEQLVQANLDIIRLGKNKELNSEINP